MSSVSKGNAYELEAKKTLEANGWTVFRQHRKPLFIQGKMVTVGADVFGCDLIAKRHGLKPLWIQVSTLENLSKKKLQIQSYPLLTEHETYEIWIRIKGTKEFEIYTCVENGAKYDWVKTGVLDIQEKKQ